MESPWQDQRLYDARKHLKDRYEALDAVLNHRDGALAGEAIAKLHGALDAVTNALAELGL